MKKKILIAILIVIAIVSVCFAFVGCNTENNKINETRTANILFNYSITTQFQRSNYYLMGSLIEKPENPIYFNHVFNAGYYGSPETKINDFDVPIDNPRIEQGYDADKNYRFIAWYTEPEFLYQWNFSEDRIFRDMILYAKWAEI